MCLENMHLSTARSRQLLTSLDRGVVWEETIILLPDNGHYVFLSATIPNASQFAGMCTLPGYLNRGTFRVDLPPAPAAVPRRLHRLPSHTAPALHVHCRRGGALRNRRPSGSFLDLSVA